MSNFLKCTLLWLVVSILLYSIKSAKTDRVRSSDIVFVSASNGNDTANDGRSADNAFETIAFALSSAKDGTEIRICQGIYYISDMLQINKSVTLLGISGAESTHIVCRYLNESAVHISANTWIEGLTIRNCTNGALSVEGANIAVNSSVFMSNAAHFGRGIVNVINGNGTFIMTQFSDYAWVDLLSGRYVIIKGEVISGLFVKCAFRGPLSNNMVSLESTFDSYSEFDNCEFTLCQVLALYINSKSISSIFTHCVFSHMRDGVISILAHENANCKFEDVEIAENGYISATSVASAGVLVRSEFGNVSTEFQRCNFSDNVISVTVREENAVAVTLYSDRGSVLGTFIECNFLRNLIFDYPFTSNGVGGVSLKSSVGAVYGRFENCVFHDNSGPDGGAVSLAGMDAERSRSSFVCTHFTENRAKRWYEDSSQGGAVKLDFPTPGAVTEFYNCNFTWNSAQNGGAVSIEGSARFSDNVFSNNKASNDGGALWISTTSELILEGSTFDHNTAGGNGGAIYSTTLCYVSISGVVRISGNTAYAGGGAYFQMITYPEYSVVPCGIYTQEECESDYHCIWDLSSCHLLSQIERLQSGLLFHSSAQVIVEENTASAYGGGFFLSNGPFAFHSGITVVANKAEISGGGVFLSANSIWWIKDSEMRDNVASSNGGAIYLGEGSTLSALGKPFVCEGNSATGCGGCIYLEAASTLDYVIEGSLQVLNEYLMRQSYAEGRGASLNFNTANKAGGGFYSEASSRIALKDITVNGNHVVGDTYHNDDVGGGGGYLAGSYEVGLRSIFGMSTFLKNTVENGQGGGLLIKESASHYGDKYIFMQDNVVHNGGGGAVYCSAPTTESTECGNTFSGSGWTGNVATFGNQGATSPCIITIDPPSCSDPRICSTSIMAGVPLQIPAHIYDCIGNSYSSGLFHSPTLYLDDGSRYYSMWVNGTAEFSSVVISVDILLVDTVNISVCTPTDWSVEEKGLCEIRSVRIQQCSPGLGYDPEMKQCIACVSGFTYSITTDTGYCHRCPDGEHCICRKDEVQSRSGYWIDDAEGEAKLYACDSDRCIGGQPESQCNSHRTGVLCGTCVFNYSEWNGECIDCSRINGDIIFYSLIILWVYVVLQHILSQSPSGMTRIVINFFQTFLLLISPKKLFSSDGFLYMNMPSASSDRCPFPREAFGVLICGILTPLAMITFLGMTRLIQIPLGKWVSPRIKNRKAKDVSTNLGERKAYVRTIIVLLLFSYQLCTEIAFSYMNCREVGDHVVVESEPSISCRSKAYKLWMIFFFPVLLICLSSPVILFYFLYRKRKEIDNPRGAFSRNFGILFQVYRPKYFWWECVIMLRKILLLGIYVMCSWQANWNARRIFLSIANIVILLFHLSKMPFSSKQENIMEAFSLSMLLVIGAFVGSEERTVRYETLVRVLCWMTMVIIVGTLKIYDVVFKRKSTGTSSTVLVPVASHEKYAAPLLEGECHHLKLSS